MAQSLWMGEKFEFTTAGAVTNGALLIVGDTPMVALNVATATGQKITVAADGVFELVRKASAGNVALGSKAYYVATGGVNKVTSVAASGKCIGSYAAATTTSATTCQVKLLGGPLTVAL